jgi:hypothetical protein
MDTLNGSISVEVVNGLVRIVLRDLDGGLVATVAAGPAVADVLADALRAASDQATA